MDINFNTSYGDISIVNNDINIIKTKEKDLVQKVIQTIRTNYKDYEFIPGEDTAMPKSITRYMDKSLKIATTPQTCYTWFNCDEDFLNNEKKREERLKFSRSYANVFR